MSKKSILFIAYDFPPILSPESIQVQRRALSLAKGGHKVHVLTSNSSADFEFMDHSLERTHENLIVHRVERVFFEKARHYLCAPLQLTDRKLWWKIPALKLAEQIVVDHGITRIYTHSTPLVNHLVGLDIVKIFPDISWTAHFSDPWTLNPYISYRTSLQRKANEHLERKVLDHVSCITVTSQKTRDLFINGFNLKSSKIRVLPHVFDPEMYPEPDKPAEKTIIAHTGHIYGLRTILPLIEAVKAEKPQNIEFHFYGRIKENEREAAERQTPGVFKFLDPIPFAESIAVLSRADILLVVDAPLKNSPFFPSKLADYIGACKPIAALTPSSSTTMDILASLSPEPLAADSGSAEGIRKLLRRIEAGEFAYPTVEKTAAYNMNNSYHQIYEALIDAEL
ncbi:glycosyltransferase [Maridesulfovibrio bastinii]|uniref:glycosyltransferase n=1 Tax=Maridesulfovibrio bastinii TaxID=47157 RepID=UPI00040EA786|nr:glycosyltransferase [Maridesulfovibrio bastinii]